MLAHKQLLEAAESLVQRLQQLLPASTHLFSSNNKCYNACNKTCCDW